MKAATKATKRAKAMKAMKRAKAMKAMKGAKATKAMTGKACNDVQSERRTAMKAMKGAKATKAMTGKAWNDVQSERRTAPKRTDEEWRKIVEAANREYEPHCVNRATVCAVPGCVFCVGFERAVLGDLGGLMVD